MSGRRTINSTWSLHSCAAEQGLNEAPKAPSSGSRDCAPGTVVCPGYSRGCRNSCCEDQPLVGVAELCSDLKLPHGQIMVT